MNELRSFDHFLVSEPLALRVRRNLGALWQGFVTPSAMAFGLILAMTAFTAAALCLMVTPHMLAGPLGVYLPRTAKDTEATATHKALALAVSTPPSGVPRLCMVSDSVLAHSFADEGKTATALQHATGKTWQVSFLTTPLQGPIDQATLADYATRKGPCLMVLGLSFMRYEATPAAIQKLDGLMRLGLTSPWANAERATIRLPQKHDTGIYALDNGRFLSRHAPTFVARLFLHRAASTPIAAYAPRHPLGPDELDKRRRIIIASLFETNNALPDKTLARLMTLLAGRHAPVLFVEEPVSPGLFRTAGEKAAYQAYLGRSEQIARQMGGTYCRTAAAQPPAEQYADYLHLTDQRSQEQLRQLLSACVAHAIADHEVKP